MSLFGKLIGNAAGGSSIGGAIGSGTEGSVLFLGAGGILAQDNANFFRSAAQLKFKTITEAVSGGAVRIEFAGINGSYTEGLHIRATDASSYASAHIVLSNQGYGRQSQFGVGSTNGLNFLGSDPATWFFGASLSGAAKTVNINSSTAAVAGTGVLEVNAGYAAQAGLRINLAATPTADAFQVFASDGTTKVFSVDPSGFVSFGSSALDGGGFFSYYSGNTYITTAPSSYNSLQFKSGMGLGWTAGATANAAADSGISRYAAGALKVTDGADTNIRGLLGGGASVASAAALPLPTGRIFHVTGTTGITSITSTNFQSGAIITLIFDGVLTVTDGSNLKMAGNFTTTADDTLTLGYDGTNWYEICRSVN